MEPICISYNEHHEYYIYKIPAISQLSCEVLSLTLSAKLISMGLSEEIAKRIAENASLVYLSAFTHQNKKAFNSPRDVLEKITLDELAFIANKSISVQKSQGNALSTAETNPSFDEDEFNKLKYGE